jgi:NitT/TauT family transport system substrate-binding protein
VTQNPDEAASIIASKSTPDDEKAIASLIKSNERLGMNVGTRSWPSIGRRSRSSVEKL